MFVIFYPLSRIILNFYAGSPVCFIVACFNYPGAIRSAWGCMEEELDDHTWELLNGPAENQATGNVGLGLGMLVKMTRLHDLGLAQLCLGLDPEGEECGTEVRYGEVEVAVP